MKRPGPRPAPGISVRVFERSEWQSYRDLRLRALGDAPDAFGTTLAQARQRSDTHWKSRLADTSPDTDLALLGEVDGVGAGLAWGRIEPTDRDVACVYQMWASPEHRGCGLGRKLLTAVIDWARSRHALRVELGVTCGNSAARTLYASAGFKPVGDPEPLRKGSALLAQSMVLEISSGDTSG